MRKLLIAAVAFGLLALALSGPVPAWGVWVAEKSLGEEHPSARCLARREDPCRAGQALFVWALVNVKRALPADRPELARTVDGLIDFYSSNRRQEDWQRSFQELDELGRGSGPLSRPYSRPSPYSSPAPYRRRRL